MKNNGDKEECLSSPLPPFHIVPSLIKAAHEREQKHGQGIERFRKEIEEWEYAYCPDCKQIRFSSELEATDDGIRCAKCNSDKVEAPGWITCPHYKEAIVKCPRAGKGIVHHKYGMECQDHCGFRLSKNS